MWQLEEANCGAAGLGQWVELTKAIVPAVLGVGSSVIQSEAMQQQAKALAQMNTAQAKQLAQQIAADVAARQAAANLEQAQESFGAQQLQAQQTYSASLWNRNTQIIGLVALGGAALAIGWYLLKHSKKGK